MVNNMNSDDAIAQTGSARAEVTAPNKNSSIHSSDCQPAANNRDLALTRKRTGHIDAAVRHMGHFVAVALMALGGAFELITLDLVLIQKQHSTSSAVESWQVNG